MYLIDAREKLDNYDIPKLILKLSLKNDVEKLLNIYREYNEIKIEYFKLLKEEYYDHYLCNGGFGLNSNLFYLKTHAHYQVLTAALGFAREARDEGKEDNFDFDFYQKLLCKGLEAEKSYYKFIKSLSQKQLFELLLTGSYSIN